MTFNPFSAPHPLQGCWELAAAQVQAEALDCALALDILPVLTCPTAAATVAEQRRLAPHAVALLLELLWSMGVLDRLAPAASTSASMAPVPAPSAEHAPRYRLSQHAARYLLPGAADDCGQAWRFRRQSLQRFSQQLHAYLTTGAGDTPPAAHLSGDAAGWAAAAKAQIRQEQHALTAPAALAVLAQADVLAPPPGGGRFLDLGGGPGLVAVAIAHAEPQWRGVVFDWAESVAVAQRHIDEAGLSARLGVLGGDLTHDALDAGDGEGYDLVWCSSVLHFVPDPGATLAKIHAALKPGGVLISAHAEISPEREAAARVLPFYLPMRMLGRQLLSYEASGRLLQQAGFATPRRLHGEGFPMVPLQVWIARKEPA